MIQKTRGILFFRLLSETRRQLSACGLALEQPFEGEPIEEIEGTHDNISRQVLTIVAYPDTLHPRTTCSFDAGNRVLHDNTPAPICTCLPLSTEVREVIFARLGRRCIWAREFDSEACLQLGEDFVAKTLVR